MQLNALWIAGLLISATPMTAAGVAADPPVPAVVEIPAGAFLRGSDQSEREAGYKLDENAYGHNRTRIGKWYDFEAPRARAETGRFQITKTPITNAQYAAFLAASGHRAPDVDPTTWQGYKLIHPYERTRRHAWSGGAPPAGREDHPVVLGSLVGSHQRPVEEMAGRVLEPLRPSVF